MKKRNRKLLLAAMAVLLLGAVLLTAWPLLANAVNEKHASRVRVRYADEVEKLENGDLREEWEKAERYNASLQPVRFTKEALAAAAPDYETLLDPDGSGIMGFLEIPAIRTALPVYHGTAEETLQKGAGHLAGSSLPVGGEGSRCVLTGHSGVAGNRLFSDLDRLGEGDLFYLHVLGRTLAYRVSDIRTVLPYETEALEPVAGKDLCTLVTCTPYGVNTHRLLVTGERTEYTEQEKTEEETETAKPVPSTWREQYVRGLKTGGLCAAGLLAVVLPTVFVREKRRKKRGS